MKAAYQTMIKKGWCDYHSHREALPDLSELENYFIGLGQKTVFFQWIQKLEDAVKSSIEANRTKHRCAQLKQSMKKGVCLDAKLVSWIQSLTV